jgi:hypothetical protein
MSAADIIQLTDACIGITKTIISIGRAAKDAHGLPKDLANLFEQFPAVQDLFEKAKQNNDNFEDDSRRSAEPVLKQCKEALDELQKLFEKVCPPDGANCLKRVWKGTKAEVLGRNTRLQESWKKVEGCLDLLEKSGVVIIGGKLDDLKKAVDSLAEDGCIKNANYGSGPQNNNNGNGKQWNQGGGEGNTFAMNFNS